ncbi:MAG: tetratricopeptide repeat protein [Myxococcales bacterium]|nr:tetratricopeptide repeat protein [Myxococcales bacterium]
MSRQHRFRFTPLLAAAAIATATITPVAQAAPAKGGAATPTDPDAAAADDGAGETADSLSAEAVARFQAKDFEGAVEYFNRAYSLDGNPNFLFNIGRVYEEAGELTKAVEYYERFIKEPGVDLDSRGIALDRLKILRAVIAETAPKEPEPAPVAEPEPEPEPQVIVPEPEPEPEPKSKKGRGLRIAGYTLLGIGGAALVGGGAFGGIALSQSNKLDMTDGYDERQELIRVGQTNATVADALLISGGVLAGTGLVLVLASLRGRKAAKADVQARRRSFAPVLGRDTVGVAVGGRF